MIGIVRVKMLKGEKGDTGATGDYSGIDNKPLINGVELDGDKSASDLGLASAVEQQNLLETVGGLNSTVGNIEAEISDINGEIGDINSSINGVSGDVAELQRVASHGAFTITANYDPATKAMTNPTATAAEVYTAVHDEKRPCFLIGVDNNGRDYTAICIYSARSAAYFVKSDAAGIDFDTWLLSESTFVYIPSTTTGRFTPETNVSLLDGEIKQIGHTVSVRLFLEGQFDAGENVIGSIGTVSMPSGGWATVCACGTPTNLTKTGLAIIDPNGDIRVKTDASMFGNIAIYTTYIVE